MNKRPKQTAATRAKIMAAYMEIAKEKGTQKHNGPECNPESRYQSKHLL